MSANQSTGTILVTSATGLFGLQPSTALNPVTDDTEESATLPDLSEGEWELLNSTGLSNVCQRVVPRVAPFDVHLPSIA